MRLPLVNRYRKYGELGLQDPIEHTEASTDRHSSRDRGRDRIDPTNSEMVGLANHVRTTH
ncbi:hypothetical protein EEB12_29320 [Rhodococcus sp. WS1]|nr:hypothetical protein EEB12_29320 [Rhodococcus sp. WS1]